MEQLIENWRLFGKQLTFQWLEDEGEEFWLDDDESYEEDDEEGASARGSSTPARWIGPGEVVTIAGREIRGMIYVGARPPLGECRKHCFLRRWKSSGWPWIDPELPAAPPDACAVSVDSWFSLRYNEMLPSERGHYLDWLASGASDGSCSRGEVLLYFYGLEYRFFVEESDASEQEYIVAEVERLLSLYASDSGRLFSLSLFLGTAYPLHGRFNDTALLSEGAVADTLLHGPGFTLDIRCAVGRMVAKRQPLTADWLLTWYLAHPDTNSLRHPARRAPQEFLAMYRLLFNDRYPKGVKVRVPKRAVLGKLYIGASELFDIELEEMLGRIPDCRRLTRPLNQAHALLEQTENALNRYSLYLGRKPDQSCTIEAHLLLPKRLRPLFPSKAFDEFGKWLESKVSADGVFTIGQVVGRVLGSSPERVVQQHKLLAAEALGALGFGMVPCVGLSLRRPRAGDPVVLFKVPQGYSALEKASMGYGRYLVVVAAGAFVARAGGTISSNGRDVIQAWIEEAELAPDERARLSAELAWMLMVPLSLSILRRCLGDAAADTCQDARRLALAAAAADGADFRARVRPLKKVYRASGVEIGRAQSDLEDLGPLDGPVTVRLESKSGRVYVVPRPATTSRVQLDASRVKKLIESTDRVYNELNRVFGEAEEEEVVVADSLKAILPGLDAAYVGFLRSLAERHRWKKTELITLATQHKLMPDGALETLNDWCAEQLDEVLVEDEDEHYELNQEAVAQLKLLESN